MAAGCLVCASAPAQAAESSRKSYDIAPGDAAGTLKRFADDSGRQVVYLVDAVRGVTTNAVRGEYTVREALTRLVADTGLVVVEDAMSGALMVNRAVSTGSPPSKPNPQPKSNEVPPVKKRTFLAIVAGWLLAVGTPFSQAAQSPDTVGTLTGQISNAATHVNLSGAHVMLVELGRETVSDRDGTYVFSDLAPGAYTVSADYPGLDTATQKVSVQAGTPARAVFELASNLYVMESFVVAGQREGNAAAIVQQREAVNVQNVITSDAFGNTAKGNIANFLARLPGVTGMLGEVDNDTVLVRGMPAGVTSVDIDGTRATSGISDRAQNLGSIPTDFIERAEVIKGTTPDIDADSLGGRINLTTKSAFDRKGRNLDVQVAESYSLVYRNKVSENGDVLAPSLSVSYSDLWSVLGGSRNFGAFGNASYYEILDARETVNTFWNNASGGSQAANQKAYAQFSDTSVELHKQTRSGGSVRFDYRTSDRSSYTLSMSQNHYGDNFFRTRSMINPGTVDIAKSDPDPFYTVVNNAAYKLLRDTRNRGTNRFATRFAGKNDLDDFKFSYDLSYDKANLKEFRRNVNPVSNSKFSYAYDRRTSAGADVRWPRITLLSGGDPFKDDLSNVSSAPMQGQATFSDDEIFGSHVDVEKPLNLRWPVKLKAGLRYRQETRHNNVDKFVATLATTDLRPYVDPTWNYGGSAGRYPVSTVVSTDKVWDAGKIAYLGGNDPGKAWSWDPKVVTFNSDSTYSGSLLSDYRMEEDISAGYLQGSVALGKFSLLTGARLEHTELQRRVAARNRNATNPLDQYSGRFRDTNNYDDLFPSAHARYAVSKNLVLHAAYSTTIGRPGLSDLTKNSDYDIVKQTVTSNDGSLKPQYSKNYDLSIEYYLKPVGVISAGVFEKRITDYISTRTTNISEVAAANLGVPISNPNPNNGSWLLTTTTNSGGAKVRGTEFNYSQQLSFLPSNMKGLGVFANYTVLRAEGTFATGGTTNISTLAGFAPKTGNLGVSYDYGRWDVRVMANYVGSYLDTDSSVQGSKKFADKRVTWNFSGKYKLGRNYLLFADMLNFTRTNLVQYLGAVDGVHRSATQVLGATLTTGIQAKF